MFTLTFVSILASSSVPAAPAHKDAFEGWTCTMTSLAQQSDERAGRDSTGSATVRVCTAPKGGK
jgi:hypothetical protein